MIRQLNGSDVANGSDLLQILAKQQPGDEIQLGVVRDQENLTMDVKLKRRNEVYEER